MKSFALLLTVVMFSCVAVAFAADGKFLADRHTEDYGNACQDCHEEEAPEAGAWVDGVKCLACHGTWEDLGKLTENRAPYNPHDSHLGEPDCTICHMGHVESTLYCTKCHNDVDPKMP